jgi:hypothetical protein
MHDLDREESRPLKPTNGSPFTVQRSPFSVHRSPFSVRRSPFAVHRA